MKSVDAGVYVPTLAALDAEVAKRATCAWYRYFPAEGVLGRGRYPKQIAFMRAGAVWRSRALCAGNRCLTWSSVVETEAGPQTVGSLFLMARPFRVWAWDGRQRVLAQAGIPFQKPGRDVCYRITMADGQWVEVSEGHRIATDAGWRRMDVWLQESGVFCRGSSGGAVRSTRLSSDRRWWRSAEDCRARDADDVRRGGGGSGGGGRLQRARESVRSWLCRQGGGAGSSAWCLSSNHIVSVHSIPNQPVYDFEVETYHNYIAADLVHHNTGKTSTAAYELVCHLNGSYPAWWEGKRFAGPIEAWCAGDTGQTTRDIIQVALLGPLNVLDSRAWCGMIPRAQVYDVSRKPGIPDAVSTVWVRHASGGMSSVDFKSFDQKREAYQGTAKHVVWLDEEPDDEIYGECVMRTMTTEGTVLVTLTPLQGLTPFLAGWLEKSVLEVFGTDGVSQLVPARSRVFAPDVSTDDVGRPLPVGGMEALTRYLVMATWDDCPHLSVEAKAAMLAEYPPYQQEARRRGIPALGSGTMYPVPETSIAVSPFEVPAHWPRVFGMDLDAGAGWTAAVWMAWDRETDTDYVYDVYKRSHAEPIIHAEAVKARGGWIPGLADAAALLVTAHDAQQYLSIYRRLELDVTLPDKSVEAGIQLVWERLSGGHLKVFASCGAWFDEYRLYRRDSKGRVVKANDHLMDGTRYVVMDKHRRAKTKPGTATDTDRSGHGGLIDRALGWMGV